MTIEKIKQDKKYKFYKSLAMWTFFCGLFFFPLMFVFFVSEILLIKRIKELAKEYNLKIDWRHYLFGWGRERLKEKSK